MIDRYNILCYLNYDWKGPYADWEESKDDDGKFVLFTDHQKQMTATETQARIDSAKRQHEIDALKLDPSDLDPSEIAPEQAHG